MNPTGHQINEKVPPHDYFPSAPLDQLRPSLKRVAERIQARVRRFDKFDRQAEEYILAAEATPIAVLLQDAIPEDEEFTALMKERVATGEKPIAGVFFDRFFACAVALRQFPRPQRTAWKGHRYS